MGTLPASYFPYLHTDLGHPSFGILGKRTSFLLVCMLALLPNIPTCSHTGLPNSYPVFFFPQPLSLLFSPLSSYRHGYLSPPLRLSPLLSLTALLLKSSLWSLWSLIFHGLLGPCCWLASNFTPLQLLLLAKATRDLLDDKTQGSLPQASFYSTAPWQPCCIFAGGGGVVCLKTPSLV